MPKIIENLPRMLTEEARRQVQSAGYGALTIRSVAAQCGVGIGTVYNYYPSKEALVASFLLEDWKAVMETVCSYAEAAEDPIAVSQVIYDNLNAFSLRHQAVFRDEAATVGFSGSFSRYHGLLRSQLAAPIRKFCPDDFTADFVAEALLVWTIDGRPFRDIRSIIQKLF